MIARAPSHLLSMTPAAEPSKLGLPLKPTYPVLAVLVLAVSNKRPEAAQEQH